MGSVVANEPHLAMADADKIHEYVFSPRELKMIRGGSAIQVDLNYDRLPELAKQSQGDVIYRGGGTVLAVFPSEGQANQFCREAKVEFARKTGTATVTTAAAKYNSQDFRGSLRRLRNELERNKQARSERVFNGGGSFWANCQGCGVFPAVTFSKRDPGVVLCKACDLREQASQRGRNYSKGVEPPEDFEAIGLLGKPQNYVALIYLDLDRLGRHLSEWAEGSRESYEQMSRLIDDSVKMAVRETCEEKVVFDKGGVKKAGYEILLQGGDDAVLLVPGQLGLPVIQRFGERYRAIYEDAKTGTKTPIFSAGMVIAHSKFPISDLLSIAEELLRSAKTLKADAVDFAVISSSMSDSPVRDRHVVRQRSDGMERTMKPYALSDLMVQVSNMGELKRTAPSSKVKALYRIAHESVMQAELEYLDLLRRLEEGSKTQMLKTVGMEFWNTAASGRKGTRAADIVELWDFCGA